MFFLDGLRKRSQHFLVLRPLKARGNSQTRYLDCKEGDLLRVVGVNEEVGVPEGCAHVVNTRTNQRGNVPRDQLYVVPCLEGNFISKNSHFPNFLAF